MTDGTFPDRVVQLRSRWEADPTSRVFLQLAEEYRHLGRVKEALEVLEKGLKEHPGYLSALVAKGRCYLELGEPQLARGVLERVVKQDATQMVANKLLVRAYLETGEPGQARERLDLYSLLNDSDPEIEDLRRRIKAAERPAPPPPVEEAEPEADEPFALMDALAPAPAPAAAPAPTPAAPLEDDVFDLGLAPAPPPKAATIAAMDVFELDAPAPIAPAASVAEPDLRPLAVVPTAPDPFTAAEEVAVIQSTVEPEPAEDDVFAFAGVSSRAGQQRYLASLAAEGIFDFEPQPIAAAAAPAPAPPAPAVPAPAPEPEPVFDLPPVPAEAAAPPAAIQEPFEMPAAEPPRFMTWADPAPFAELAEPATPVAEVAEPEPLAEPFPLPEPEPVPAPPSFHEASPLDLETPEAPPWEPEPVAAPAFFEPEPAPTEDLEPPVYAQTAEPVMDYSPPAPAAPATPAATVTLGELYLRQGHFQEARRIFGEIVEREPDHAAARDGLERVGQALAARERRPVEASELLAGFDPDAAEGGASARKVFLLNSYLARVRRGRQRDVS